MKKEVQAIFQEVTDTLHQKIFWKIQGLNLFMIMKRIVYYVLIALSLIFVISITLQGLHLSSSQKVNMELGISLCGQIIVFIRMFKNIFRGRDRMIVLLKTVVNGFLWTLFVYLAITINLTNYDKISNLIQGWFVVGVLFKLNEILIFRKLSKEVENGKKFDWLVLVGQQVNRTFDNGILLSVDISEMYKLRYSRVNFKFNRATTAVNKAILGKSFKVLERESEENEI